MLQNLNKAEVHRALSYLETLKFLAKSSTQGQDKPGILEYLMCSIQVIMEDLNANLLKNKSQNIRNPCFSHTN